MSRCIHCTRCVRFGQEVAGETARESATYEPGDRAVTADVDGLKLGLTICYDLRFPALYRALALAGAEVMTIPAAFTRPTGEAHWEVLMRARAIETGSYVLAAAQGGIHEDRRGTWGRSLVVGPWGQVVASLDHDEPGVLVADLDPAAPGKARAAIPALHDHEFEGWFGSSGDYDDQQARGLIECIARAKHSLPTPLSPRNSTVESVGATRRTRLATALKPGEAPTKPSKLVAVAARPATASASGLKPGARSHQHRAEVPHLGLAGDDVDRAAGKETREINGKHYVLEYPIVGDVALIKAECGDRWGNLTYRKAARNFGPVMATA
eukprot:gene6267-8474_t